MRSVVIWILVGLLLASMGANKYLLNKLEEKDGDLANANIDKINEVIKAKNAEWDKQRVIQLSHDSIKTSKEQYAQTIDSLLQSHNVNVNRLESALMLKSHWIDSVKQMAVMEKPQLRNPQDTNKINPLLSIKTHLETKCWGMKGNIVTHDPESFLEVLEQSTNTYTNLLVYKEKRFLFWVTRKAEYHIYNDCGEVGITNVKIQ